MCPQIRLSVGWLACLLLVGGYPCALADRPEHLELTGTVRTASGQPARNCQLFIAAPSKNRWSWSQASEIVDQFELPIISTITDARGEYRLTIDLSQAAWLSPGEGIIVAHSPDGQVAHTSYKLSRARIDLPLDIQLTSSRSLTLKIVDDSGQPLPGLDVSPARLAHRNLPLSISQQWSKTTDQAGQVSFDAFSDITAVFVSGAAIGQQYLLVKATADQQPAIVTVRPARARTVRCQADDDSSTSLPTIHWTIISFRNVQQDTELAWQEVTTDGNQPVETAPMTGDTWIALNDADSGHGWLHAASPDLQVAQPQSEVTLHVKRGIHVTGKVVSAADGQPLAGISLQHSLSLGNLVSRADGSYELWLPLISDGTYPIDALELHFFQRPFFVRPAAEHAPGEARMPVFELTRSSEAVGTVLGPDGQPLPGVKVHCASQQERFSRNDQFVTDRHGQFRLWSLADGTPVKFTVFDQRGATAAPFEWAIQGPEVPTLQLVAPQPKKFRGRIVDQAGKPVVGAKIEVRRADIIVSGNLSGAVYNFQDALADQASGSAANTILTDSYGWFESESCFDWQHLFSPRVVHPGYREKIGWLHNGAASYHFAMAVITIWPSGSAWWPSHWP